VLLELPFVGAYDWPLALRMIGAHAVPGGEVTDPAVGTHRRLLPSSVGPLAVTVSPGDTAITVHVDGAISAADVDDLTGRLRHWLDLDLDPASQVFRFGDDSTLGPLVRERPGLRRIRYPESYEAAISTVLGQQVSLAAARTFAGRLVAAYGASGPGGLRSFPPPELVAAIDLEELRRAVGITGSRARTLLAVSELFARTGGWPVPLPPDQWEERAASLLAVPGIGPWTVAYLRMRLFGDPDAVPVGDLVLRRALGVAKDREVPAAMAGWRPQRSYAVFQLWASTAW
jgi:3-methyladenine DNA glycosylase/8-oxoguanine DNA glycosylase